MISNQNLFFFFFFSDIKTMFCLTFLSSKLYIDYPRKYLCKHKDPITGNSFIVCTTVAHFAEFTVGLMKINSGQLVCLANAAIVLISW